MRYFILLAAALISAGPGLAATGDGALSADGASVAFVAIRDGLAQGRIFVYDIATGRLEEVSVSTRGERADFDSFERPAISADGQRIAFTSFATNLTEDPDNSTVDVFLRDRSVPETVLPLVGQSGSQAPVLSRDGMIMAFFGNQAVPEDATSSTGEPYVVDLSNGSIQIATIDPGGNQIGGAGTLNGDGSLYAFEHDDRIYLRDLELGVTQLLGSFPAFFTFFSDLSADGNSVVFQTTAGLDAVDTNGRRDLYVLDVSVGGGPQLISYDQGGGASNQDSFGARISDNGRYVAFTSLASDLVIDDLNGKRDVFLRDRVSGSIQRISTSTTGEEGNGDSRIQDISSDGLKVLFSSQATNLAAGSGDCIFQNSCNLFLHDVMAGTTVLIPPPDAVRAQFPSAGAAGDAFGTGVAVSGNLIAIGAPSDDDAGPDAGAVSIFRIEGTVPVLDQKVVVPVGFTATGFGTAVALSGTTLVVGAPATGAEGKGPLAALQGAIFERLQSGWTFKQPLSGQGGGNDDGFGAAVSIDGDHVVVGAPLDSESGSGSGAAYTFALDGNQFVMREKIMPIGPTPGEGFGSAVGVKGNLFAFGSPQGGIGASTTGSVTVFEEVAGNLRELGAIAGSDSANGDGFGAAIAIDGTRIVVGAPGVDADRADQGAVYIFDAGASGITELGSVRASLPEENARFGASVAASGGAFAVGAPAEGNGAVYRFDSQLAQTARLVPRAAEIGFGQAIALADDRLVVGAALTDNLAGAAVLESDPENLFESSFK